MSIKKYKLTTIKELADLANEKNIDNLTQDLKLWLTFVINARKVQSPLNKFMKVLGIRLPKKVNAIEPVTEYFTWIDDGKHDPHINILVKK